ncbi:MAG TPA: phosphatidylglycerophosphatase A [Terriglobales bacterium]|nr:phosphatidylglycerophosphatase A [Terriglobales bacterium]
MAKSYSILVATAFPRHATAWEKLQHVISIGGPIGFIPWVPATCASAAVAGLCWLRPPSAAVVLAVTAVLYLAGGFTATTSERVLNTQDPRNVVVDELAGQLLTFLWVAPVSPALAIGGFLLFRLFDIAKPFPANIAERLPAGWGIMTDDIVAGLFAALALWLLRAWI